MLSSCHPWRILDCLHLKDGCYKKSARLNDLLIAENNSGINDFQIYAGFAENCMRQKERLRHMVSSTESGKKIQA